MCIYTYVYIYIYTVYTYNYIYIFFTAWAMNGQNSLSLAEKMEYIPLPHCRDHTFATS